MSSALPGSTISAIMRHDSEVTSYKIALLRAMNDVALAYSDVTTNNETVAIPCAYSLTAESPPTGRLLILKILFCKGLSVSRRTDASGYLIPA